MNCPVLAPGARVLIRDAEWLVRKVDRTASGRQAVAVVGLSQIFKDPGVRQQKAYFDLGIEVSD